MPIGTSDGYHYEDDWKLSSNEGTKIRDLVPIPKADPRDSGGDLTPNDRGNNKNDRIKKDMENKLIDSVIERDRQRMLASPNDITLLDEHVNKYGRRTAVEQYEDFIDDKEKFNKLTKKQQKDVYHGLFILEAYKETENVPAREGYQGAPLKEPPALPPSVVVPDDAEIRTPVIEPHELRRMKAPITEFSAAKITSEADPNKIPGNVPTGGGGGFKTRFEKEQFEFRQKNNLPEPTKEEIIGNMKSRIRQIEYDRRLSKTEGEAYPPNAELSQLRRRLKELSK